MKKMMLTVKVVRNGEIKKVVRNRKAEELWVCVEKNERGTSGKFYRSGERLCPASDNQIADYESDKIIMLDGVRCYVAARGV